MPNYSGRSTNSYIKVYEVCEVCLFSWTGGATYSYRALYVHGFAGMQGMRVLGGVALGSEAMPDLLQR